MIRSHLLIVTPLQEDYDGLYNNMCSFGMDTYSDKIGRLEVFRAPALNALWRAARGLAPGIQAGDGFVATGTIERDDSLKSAQRFRPQYSGDAQGMAAIWQLGLADAGFAIHAGIMADGDEDVIELWRSSFQRRSLSGDPRGDRVRRQLEDRDEDYCCTHG